MHLKSAILSDAFKKVGSKNEGSSDPREAVLGRSGMSSDLCNAQLPERGPFFAEFDRLSSLILEASSRLESRIEKLEVKMDDATKGLRSVSIEVEALKADAMKPHDSDLSLDAVTTMVRDLVQESMANPDFLRGMETSVSSRVIGEVKLLVDASVQVALRRAKGTDKTELEEQLTKQNAKMHGLSESISELKQASVEAHCQALRLIEAMSERLCDAGRKTEQEAVGGEGA